jgi:hypothetical protein
MKRMAILLTAVQWWTAVSVFAQTNVTESVQRIDIALQRAGTFLVNQQEQDGSWRSERYGVFRDGMALTPLVSLCVRYLPQAGPEAMASHQHGHAFLANAVESMESDTTALAYPVYTAALSAMGGIMTDQRRWLDILMTRQFSSANGWSEEDAHFGGWGFGPRIPKKSGNVSPYTANISATVYALGALRSSGLSPTNQIFTDALIFLQRCRNPFPGDGGFYFSPGDDAANKAGGEGDRFYSYGSATADGVRGLLLCGLTRDHPYVADAALWLDRNFSTTNVPGAFTETREPLRNAYYYYYVWSVSHALHVLGAAEANGMKWAGALADVLIERQLPDGSWSNDLTDMREDDPLIATPFAASALALCRKALITPPEAIRPVAHGPVY